MKLDLQHIPLVALLMMIVGFIAAGSSYGIVIFSIIAIGINLFSYFYSDSIVLEKYTQNRIIDKKLLIQSTHNLNRLFSNSSITFSLFRKIGMRIFNKSKFLKEQSMLFAMGLKDFKL